MESAVESLERFVRVIYIYMQERLGIWDWTRVYRIQGITSIVKNQVGNKMEYQYYL